MQYSTRIPSPIGDVVRFYANTVRLSESLPVEAQDTKISVTGIINEVNRMLGTSRNFRPPAHDRLGSCGFGQLPIHLHLSDTFTVVIRRQKSAFKVHVGP